MPVALLRSRTGQRVASRNDRQWPSTGLQDVDLCHRSTEKWLGSLTPNVVARSEWRHNKSTLLRANPSKDGDAESRGYRGSSDRPLCSPGRQRFDGMSKSA